MQSLLEPVRLGDVALRNRVVMAPAACANLARGRLPTDRMRLYYAQRAAAGLVIAEASSVSPLGVACPTTPGIWNSHQAQAWRAITRAVHERGGRIFLQLCHAGRVSDPEFLLGEMPVAPSAVACRGPVGLHRARTGLERGAVDAYVVPRSLQACEIERIINDFSQAARYAREAEFDGVEIHAGDGYLIDQFLHDGSNRRQDGYGGGLANRCRFLLEIVDACIGIWGAGRVGVHLSPRGDRHDMCDSDPAALYRYAAEALGQRELAFVCVRERDGEDALTPAIRQAFGGPVVLNEGYDASSARDALLAGRGEAVAFGRAFVYNPDLVRRLAAGEPLFMPGETDAELVN